MKNIKNVAKKDREAIKGENNVRWSGGTNSYYKNHYQLKLNRKEKLKQVNNKCEKCGDDKSKLYANHKNGNKNDHIISNLEILCSK